MRKGKEILIEKKILLRTRLNDLLEYGTGYNVITVVAGIGYGKTTALKSFLSTKEAYVWIHLSSLDRDPQKFWAHILSSLIKVKPSLASKLANYKKPHSAAEFIAYLDSVNEEFKNLSPLLFVFDDYGVIKNTESAQLISSLATNIDENFKVIILSSVYTDIDSYLFKNGIQVFSITDDDLSFNLEETKKLFALSDIKISETAINKIYKNTRGWPVAIDFIVQQFKEKPSFRVAELKTGLLLAFKTLKEDYFEIYDSKIRDAILKLSLLQEFRIKMLADIFDYNISKIAYAIETNLFIKYNSLNHKHSFHPLYKGFLNEKISLLSKKERSDFIKIACSWLCKNGFAFEAIVCYFENKLFVQMLEVISNFEEVFSKNTQHEYIVKCLKKIPESYIKNSPFARYLLAVDLLEHSKLSEVENALNLLEEELLGSSLIPLRKLLGEVYIAKAILLNRQSKKEFMLYFKKASQILSRGSRFPFMQKFILRDSLIFCDKNIPGSLVEIEAAYYKALPYINQLMNDEYKGLDNLFSAEKAFYTMDFAEAQKQSCHALLKATQYGHLEITGRARFTLLRTAMLCGQFDEIIKQIENIHKQLAGKADTLLFVQRDCLESWFSLAMKDYSRIPRWILENNDENPILQWGAQKLIYARSLLHKEKYYELLAFLDYAEEYCSENGYYMGCLYCYILRSAGNVRLGDYDAALEAFAKAYEMSYNNNIITPFVESATVMRRIIDLARKDDKYKFDGKWLDTIYTKCSSFAKRLNKMSALYAKHNKVLPDNYKSVLSKKEYLILVELSSGFTREEIADSHNISDNTVNTHTKNIFRKLNAVNSAEAVHRAHILGILKN